MPGYGHWQAGITLVDEGLGFEEDRQERPFGGRSGQFLTKMLNSVDIRRHDVYITNVAKCRPPNYRDPLPEKLAACSDYLTYQVALINPRIIVTLGRFSRQRRMPGASITNVHGQLRKIGRGRVALATFHSAVLRNLQWRVEFAQDLQILPKLIARAHSKALPAGVPRAGDLVYQPNHTQNVGPTLPFGEITTDVQAGRLQKHTFCPFSAKCDDIPAWSSSGTEI